jgi:hypothetical protein
MDFATAHLKSARPNDNGRNALLCEALLRRRAELQQGWKHLLPPEFRGALGPLAPEVEAFLSRPDPVGNGWLPSNFTWLSCEADLCGCLRSIALGTETGFRLADSCPARLSLSDLKRLSGIERFNVLSDRYRCPLNIGARGESEVAEELLRHLMVVERAKLAKGTGLDAAGVLLELNLVGIRALLTRDLRSFDALNYFYELPPSALIRLRANPRLFAFWLCIYAQLLSKQDWLRCG